MKSKYYAVKKGKKVGIFSSWDDCSEQVKGYSGAMFKSFKTKEEAEEYLGVKKKKKTTKAKTKKTQKEKLIRDFSYFEFNEDTEPKHLYFSIKTEEDEDLGRTFVHSREGLSSVDVKTLFTEEYKILSLGEIGLTLNGIVYAIRQSLLDCATHITIKHSLYEMAEIVNNALLSTEPFVKAFVRYLEYAKEYVNVSFELEEEEDDLLAEFQYIVG